MPLDRREKIKQLIALAEGDTRAQDLRAAQSYLWAVLEPDRFEGSIDGKRVVLTESQYRRATKALPGKHIALLFPVDPDYPED